jgi:hypothetical protein
MKRRLMRMFAFLFLLPLGACDSVQTALYKSSIEQVYKESSLTGSAETAEHVANLRRINITSCPEDFRVAYVDWTNAWEETAEANASLAKLKENDGAAVVAGGIATFFGGNDDHPLQDHVDAEKRMAAKLQNARALVNNAGKTLDSTARKYGVQLQQ